MEKAVEEYEDSGTFPILPTSRRRRPSKDQVTDWLTWGVRLTIIGLCTLAYRQEQAIQETLQETQTTLQLTQITIAKMSVQQDMQTKQLDEHQRQLQGLWEQIRKQSE